VSKPPRAADEDGLVEAGQGTRWARRRFARGPYVTPVLVGSPTGSEIDARTAEISEEGMLVVAPATVPIGAPVTLRFASPGTGQTVVVSASVRWIRESEGRTAMGVEFINAPAALRIVVSRYIATLPAARE
jgi:c-di-GMP-binding flagellar brake protein YcgR